MSEFVFKGKSFAHLPMLAGQEPPMIARLMDGEQPATTGDLTFCRKEPDPPQVWQDMATTAGVAKGYVVFRGEDGEVQEVLDGTLLSDGDGRVYWQSNEGPTT